MIEELQKHLETLFSEITFGQIQDEEDSLMNVNITETGRKPFFTSQAKILNLSVFIREKTFEEMQNKQEEVKQILIEQFDIKKDNLHIINTKLLGTTEPFRDDKNRYYQVSTLETMIEE